MLIMISPTPILFSIIRDKKTEIEREEKYESESGHDVVMMAIIKRHKKCNKGCSPSPTADHNWRRKQLSDFETW